MNKIAIIGGGPAGIMAAIEASKNINNDIFIFDKNIILNTLLPTGGGRCNLAYSEFNFKELTKYYPRGEKFLYSIFSKFSTENTISFFDEIGVKTYTQKDSRIFPISDSAKEVKESLTKQLNKKNIKKCFENVIEIEKNNEKFIIKTNKNEYYFDVVVIATGGKGNGHNIAKNLGHNVVPLKPALCSLKTIEKDFFELSGISLKNIKASIYFENKKIGEQEGDFLFTHYGISGPLVYKISSYCAYKEFNKDKPLKIVLNLINKNYEEFNDLLIQEFDKNSKKDIKNIISNYIPQKLTEKILEKEKIPSQTKANQINKNQRKNIVKNIVEFTLNAYSTLNGEEIVTAGGINLKEINSKTMESKKIKNLYFCGEVIDVDGLTGGFNLQNCWSTGFIAGNSIKNL